jgi:hypothetical protein
MMTARAMVVITTLSLAGMAAAQETRPPRPNFDPNCSRFSMEYDTKSRRWKCILEAPLRQDYRPSPSRSSIDAPGVGGSGGGGEQDRDQQQRTSQLQAEQLQRTRQLQAEQQLRAEQQKRLTDELIRDVLQRSRR